MLPIRREAKLYVYMFVSGGTDCMTCRHTRYSLCPPPHELDTAARLIPQPCLGTKLLLCFHLLESLLKSALSSTGIMRMNTRRWAGIKGCDEMMVEMSMAAGSTDAP
jgi:hypothetical protein